MFGLLVSPFFDSWGGANQSSFRGYLKSSPNNLNEQAQECLERIIIQLKAAEGITEDLKARDQMSWVKAKNSIRNRTEEIGLLEMIYREDAA